MKCFFAAGDWYERRKTIQLNFSRVIALCHPAPGSVKKAPVFENKFQKILFHLTSVLTAWFPRGGARFLNALIPPLLGHRLLVRFMSAKNERIVRGLKKAGKILVVPDIHIGDAVMMQGAVAAFRDFFPDAQIDYIVKKSAAGLIEGNPHITHVYPRFTGSVFPAPGDIESVQALVAGNNYDVCFNGSSFFRDNWLFSKNQAVLNFMTVAPQLIRNEMDHSGINHFTHLSYWFVERLLRGAGFNSRAGGFKGATVTLSDKAVGEAQSFLREKKVPGDKPVLFLNPDTASPFTLIPFQYQARILKDWLGMDCSVLLGASFTHRDMGANLLETLSPVEKGRVFLTPSTFPLETYAALIDFADVFLSGDTGPLHIAAARKVSRTGNHPFRNRTFVISVFGATPSRMSGYDSTHPLYFPANQDVPSKTYVSGSPCRNITCVNKMVKTCEKPRCMEVLDVESIRADIKLHLRGLTGRAALLAS